MWRIHPTFIVFFQFFIAIKGESFYILSISCGIRTRTIISLRAGRAVTLSGLSLRSVSQVCLSGLSLRSVSHLFLFWLKEKSSGWLGPSHHSWQEQAAILTRDVQSTNKQGQNVLQLRKIIFKGLYEFSWRTIRYTDASKLG